MITPASPEWVPLNTVCYHLLELKLSPTPENAQRTIAAAHRSGQLHWRCTLTEHKAGRTVQVRENDVYTIRPEPVPPSAVTQNFPISSEAQWNHFDWEDCYAFSPNDPTTRSLFEYRKITANRDEVLALWPLPKEKRTRQRASANNWRTIATRELYRFLTTEKRLPSPNELAAHCEAEPSCKHRPDLSDVKKLIDKRLELLRP
jgi:hypothetical protein